MMSANEETRLEQGVKETVTPGNNTGSNAPEEPGNNEEKKNATGKEVAFGAAGVAVGAAAAAGVMGFAAVPKEAHVTTAGPAVTADAPTATADEPVATVNEPASTADSVIKEPTGHPVSEPEPIVESTAAPEAVEQAIEPEPVEPVPGEVEVLHDGVDSVNMNIDGQAITLIDIDRDGIVDIAVVDNGTEAYDLFDLHGANVSFQEIADMQTGNEAVPCDAVEEVAGDNSEEDNSAGENSGSENSGGDDNLGDNHFTDYTNDGMVGDFV